MPQDFEQFLKELFGEPLSRLTQFQGEQMKKLTDRLQQLAREATKDDLARLQQEVSQLRERVAVLEAERLANAAEQADSTV